MFKRPGLEIHAYLTTFDKRPANILAQALDSLSPQVDKLFVFRNGVQCFREDGNILHYGTSEDFGDAGKFHALWSGITAADVHFVCDDDLVYPPDYVERMLQWVGQGAAGVHSARFTCSPIASYAKHRDVRHTLAGFDNWRLEHLLGTGTSAFAKGSIDIQRHHFEDDKQADIWFALQAHKQGVPLYSVPRAANWIKLAEPHPVDTLYNRMLQEGDADQVAAVNRVKWDLALK